MSLSQVAQRNRANAQHSTGPKTPEGKAASSQNARTHGLSGKLKLKDQAETERFQKRIAEPATTDSRPPWRPPSSSTS